MYLNPSIFYSLIITISQKKCIGASVNTNLKEVKSVEAIMLLMVTYYFNIEILVDFIILKVIMITMIGE